MTNECNESERTKTETINTKEEGSNKSLVPKTPEIESTPIKLSKNKEGKTEISLDPRLSGKEAVKQLVGAKDFDIAHNVLSCGIFAIGPILIKEEEANNTLVESFNIIAQSLHDGQPRDAVEARLISQAAALYQHGMVRLSRAGASDQINNSEAQVNMAIKLLRVHNETIESLNRHRRGGEQKVTVTHSVIAGQAIVNNFTGGGVSPENKGASPCPQENAEPKQEQTIINSVVSPPCQTVDVGYTVEKAPARRRKQAKNE